MASLATDSLQREYRWTSARYSPSSSAQSLRAPRCDSEWACQLLPPLCRGLRRAGGSVDGAWQPHGALHVDRTRAAKLMAAKRNYQAHVLELLAVIHTLRLFRLYQLGGGAPRPPAGGVLDGLRPQPGDHVAQDEPAFQHAGSTRSRTSAST